MFRWSWVARSLSTTARTSRCHRHEKVNLCALHWRPPPVTHDSPCAARPRPSSRRALPGLSPTSFPRFSRPARHPGGGRKAEQRFKKRAQHDTFLPTRGTGFLPMQVCFPMPEKQHRPHTHHPRRPHIFRKSAIERARRMIYTSSGWLRCAARSACGATRTRECEARPFQKIRYLFGGTAHSYKV